MRSSPGGRVLVSQDGHFPTAQAERRLECVQRRLIARAAYAGVEDVAFVVEIGLH